jgi:hypothetical protein
MQFKFYKFLLVEGQTEDMPFQYRDLSVHVKSCCASEDHVLSNGRQVSSHSDIRSIWYISLSLSPHHLPRLCNIIIIMKPNTFLWVLLSTLIIIR